jgi:hypothetical protein
MCLSLAWLPIQRTRWSPSITESMPNSALTIWLCARGSARATLRIRRLPVMRATHAAI